MTEMIETNKSKLAKFSMRLLSLFVNGLNALGQKGLIPILEFLENEYYFICFMQYFKALLILGKTKEFLEKRNQRVSKAPMKLFFSDAEFLSFPLQLCGGVRGSM